MRAWKGPIMAATVALVFGALAGVAIGDDPPNRYTGCLGENGQLKEVAIGREPLKPCNAGWTKISFNEEGPRGPEGPQGPRGPQGIPGEPADPAEIEALQLSVEQLRASIHILENHRCSFPVPQIFAIAYMDNDETDGRIYQPSVDTLIAKVVDANHDGELNDGDCIVSHRYPTDLDVGGTAPFENATEPVFFIDAASSSHVKIVGATFQVTWEWFDSAEFEGYVEHNFDVGSAKSEFIDGFLAGFDDIIVADPFDPGVPESGSPSSPSIAVDVSTTRPGDQPFVDVDIYLS